LLVDTFDKRRGDVFDVMGRDNLAELFQQARTSDLRIVLAGSLRLARLPAVLSLRPDYVAVRGAVCHTDREGELDAVRVQRWTDALQSPAACKQSAVALP
jgi:uncharacterized protein (UPF0264 family)